MRRALLGVALFAAACAATPDQLDVPYADAPGTEQAPLRAPAPSPRGVAPKIVDIPGGPVCGDPRLVGRRMSSIGGGRGCGIATPVRVTEVSGVALTAPIRVNCDTARALADWVDQTAKPAAVATMNANLASIRPVASYACRTRNNRPGGKLSEHAKGNAVDLAEFGLSDGRTVTVLNGWRGQGAAFTKRLWKGACGPFGTVLGPNADKYHRDHFHFDVARHHGGPYCK